MRSIASPFAGQCHEEHRREDRRRHRQQRDGKIPGKGPQDPQQKGRNEGQEQPVVAGPLGEQCQRQRCRNDRKV
jgi:hypothetical protein